MDGEGRRKKGRRGGEKEDRRVDARAGILQFAVGRKKRDGEKNKERGCPRPENGAFSSIQR